MSDLQSLRRRLDNVALRWQARLDTAGADAALPWSIAGVLFVWLVSLSLARHHGLETGSDLARYVQGVWLMGQGSTPEVTVDLDEVNIFALHGSFAIYPLGFISRMLPAAQTLLVLQSFALASAVVPIWRLARRHAHLRVGGAAAVVAAYALYPAMHNLNLADFHPESLAVPALLGGLLAARSKRWLRFAVLIAYAMLCRADLGLAVFGLGLLLRAQGHRREGWITATVGLGYALLAVLVIQPALGGGEAPHADSFAAYGDSPLDALWGMVTNPLDVVGDLASRTSFERVFLLVGPVLFLPAISFRLLAPVLPLQALYLLSDPSSTDTTAQQEAAAIAFVFLATTFALAKTGRMSVERVLVHHRVLGVLVLTAAAFFISDSASSPYEEPWSWASRDIVDEARLDAIRTVPDDVAVRASPRLLPRLAERSELFVLDTADRRSDAQGAAAGVDAVVFDREEAPDWDAVERVRFARELELFDFEQVFDAEGVTVWLRSGIEPAAPDA